MVRVLGGFPIWQVCVKVGLDRMSSVNAGNKSQSQVKKTFLKTVGLRLIKSEPHLWEISGLDQDNDFTQS